MKKLGFQRGVSLFLNFTTWNMIKKRFSPLEMVMGLGSFFPLLKPVKEQYCFSAIPIGNLTSIALDV